MISVESYFEPFHIFLLFWSQACIPFKGEKERLYLQGECLLRDTLFNAHDILLVIALGNQWFRPVVCSNKIFNRLFPTDLVVVS